ncbi:MAG: hypothetical protein V4615_08825 [Bacteroidota bacterium]
MEFKVIIYIIAGVLYFIYTMNKKVQEGKQSKLPPDASPAPAKPVSPPATNPLEDIMREIKRKQAQAEAQKKASLPQPKPLTTYQQKKPQKDILIREVKKAAMVEGASAYEPVYERAITEEEKIHGKDIRLKNEGIYKVQTIEELQTETEADKNYAYNLDVRQAFIGSIIFERKY